MKLKDTLGNNGFPDNATKIILSSGIKNLYPPQTEAIKKGILDKKNVLMSAPTAAGKTLIAELCMIKSILSEKGRCLYIAPLKALASEKYRDFKKSYEPLGIKVGIAVGDENFQKKDLESFDILVATAEKVDSLLRARTTWLINSLTVVVLDEIHFINDVERGPTMEILVARIRQLNPQTQILALSATVSNASEMAEWLDAKLVLSDWRPIPLKEGVYYNNMIVFNESGTKVIAEDETEEVNKLALDTLKSDGQVLIFVNSRKSAQAVSRKASGTAAKVLSAEEKRILSDVSKKIIGNRSDSTKICKNLSDAIACGSAFHHAGLKPKQRELVEEYFKKGIIKIISCTPTLAAGVNLPARRAIIRDMKRFEVGVGSAYIPTSEYKQCAGRAGRPQYDDYGEAVMVAKSHSEAQTLFEKYINADPEPVISKLEKESSLRKHILASIASGYVQDKEGMNGFISHTFLNHQKKNTNISWMIDEIFDFLHKEKFIEKSGTRFFATTVGSLTSRLYLDPLSSIAIRSGFDALKDSSTQPSPIGILHLISCCPDAPLLKNVPKGILEELNLFISQFRNEFIFTQKNWPELEDIYNYFATIKTTWMLSQWIEEDREDHLCDTFNIGPGDVYRVVDSFQRLLYASSRIADLLHYKSLTTTIESLKTRVRYGIKGDLLELISLRGIGRIRARSLTQNGIKNISALNKLSVDKLAKISGIGKSLARELLARA